jgi:hypothetical protein
MDDGYARGTRVRAIKTRNEVTEGDEGTVVAAWVRATPLVQWDKDGGMRPLRKRNMVVIG